MVATDAVGMHFIAYYALMIAISIGKELFQNKLFTLKMSEKHDHGPNMVALQIYQTSFASGDLEKIMGVLVSTENSCCLISNPLIQA